jgi:hypothetical protein
MQVTRAKGGRMLAVAQITANQVGVDTSITDITGLSITVTPRGVIPVWVELYLWSIKQVTSNAAILAYIRNGTNVVGYALQDTFPARRSASPRAPRTRSRAVGRRLPAPRT